MAAPGTNPTNAFADDEAGIGRSAYLCEGWPKRDRSAMSCFTGQTKVQRVTSIIDRRKTMIRSYTLTAAICLASFAATSARAADSLPTETHKVLTADLAVEAAQAAIASCKAQGWNVSVTVADRSGLPKLVLDWRWRGGREPRGHPTQGLHFGLTRDFDGRIRKAPSQPERLQSHGLRSANDLGTRWRANQGR